MDRKERVKALFCSWTTFAVASHYHELWPTATSQKQAVAEKPHPLAQPTALLVPDAPTVEVRSLQLYAQWAEGVS